MTLVCTYDVPHLFPVLIIRGDVIVRLRVTFYARFRYLLLCPLDLQKKNNNERLGTFECVM